MKKKNSIKKWKKYQVLAGTFLVPLILLCIICVDHGVYPFGDRCLLQVDMYHQYCPFFTEFMEKLKAGDSLMYSWSIGLGSDFVALFAYYLASPLNWLILFCPSGYVIEFMSVLMILKIALCGLTFGYYLKKHFKTDSPVVIVFATAYALSGFLAAYSWNVMWLDSIVLTPLIVFGLEQLVKEKKPVLYYITLALSILSNYYMSIMICIFLVLYFLILWAEHGTDRIACALRFAWYSLLAGMTGAVLLIPEAIVLGESGSQGLSFPKQIEWYFNLIAELGRHSILTESYTGRDHWPNLYCGVAVLFLIVLYVCNRKIGWKKKAPRLILLAFFAVSFSNNLLDFIWHGLHFPDSLPGRQSFLYIFVLLSVCYEVVENLDGNRVADGVAALVADSIFLVAVYHLTAEEMAEKSSFLYTGALLTVYLILFLWWKKGRGQKRWYAGSIACAVMICELAVNFDVTGLDTVTRSAYTKNWKDYETVLQQAAEKEERESDGAAVFYRTEEMERKTKNDAALSGYHSATQFSSLMNINVSHIYQHLGMEGGKNFYCVNGATPLITAMLSLKYVIADNDMEESPVRTLLTSSGDTYLYENRYSLPPGFMVRDEVMQQWDTLNGTGVQNQNELAYLLGAEEALLQEIPSESFAGESVIEAEEDGYLFASYEKITADTLQEEVSSGRTKSFTKASHGYLLDLGYVRAGETVKVTNTEGQNLSLKAYRLNLDALDTAYNTLQSQTMTLESFSDRKTGGTIDVKEAGNLVFSIAKEDGWEVFVDGQKVEPELFAEAFISVPLETGTHQIELCYTTPGLKTGLAISLVGVLLFLVSLSARKKFIKGKKKSEP